MEKIMVKKDKKEITQKTVPAKPPVATKVAPAVKPEPAVAHPPDAPPSPPMSEAKKLWEEIKDVQLNMFALPDQTVGQYCKFIQIEPVRCFVTIKVSSVLTALEDALGSKYNIESAGKFVILSRK